MLTLNAWSQLEEQRTNELVCKSWDRKGSLWGMLSVLVYVRLCCSLELYTFIEYQLDMKKKKKVQWFKVRSKTD